MFTQLTLLICALGSVFEPPRGSLPAPPSRFTRSLDSIVVGRVNDVGRPAASAVLIRRRESPRLIVLVSSAATPRDLALALTGIRQEPRASSARAADEARAWVDPRMRVTRPPGPRLLREATLILSQLQRAPATTIPGFGRIPAVVVGYGDRVGGA